MATDLLASLRSLYRNPNHHFLKALENSLPVLLVRKALSLTRLRTRSFEIEILWHKRRHQARLLPYNLQAEQPKEKIDWTLDIRERSGEESLQWL